MIAQIRKISSRGGDLVLDPFAGSGAVLAYAYHMNRSYHGFYLKQQYKDMIKDYQKKTGREKNKKYLRQRDQQISQDQFNKLILVLRALKYSKIILKNLPEEIANQILRI